MTTTASPVPDHRVLYASILDPETDPAPLYEDDDVKNEAMIDAIHGGKQRHLETNGDELNLMEVCLTEFTDPFNDGMIRFAVEMWHDAANHELAKHDFASYEAAYERYVYYLNQLEFGELLV